MDDHFGSRVKVTSTTDDLSPIVKVGAEPMFSDNRSSAAAKRSSTLLLWSLYLDPHTVDLALKSPAIIRADPGGHLPLTSSSRPDRKAPNSAAGFPGLQ